MQTFSSGQEGPQVFVGKAAPVIGSLAPAPFAPYALLALGTFGAAGLAVGFVVKAGQGAANLEGLIASRVQNWAAQAGNFVSGVVKQAQATAVTFQRSAARALAAVDRLGNSIESAVADIENNFVDGVETLFHDMLSVLDGIAEHLAQKLLPILEECFNAMIDFVTFIVKEIIHIVGCLLSTPFALSIFHVIGLILQAIVDVLRFLKTAFCTLFCAACTCPTHTPIILFRCNAIPACETTGDCTVCTF